jgi:protein SFI1
MTRKSIFLRERLAEFELSRKERVFSLWYERKRERDLAPLEEEAQLKHEDALLFAVFDKWTDSSLQLQAVRFDKARLTRAALGRWKKALKRQRKIKVLDARYDRQILCESPASNITDSSRRVRCLACGLYGQNRQPPSVSPQPTNLADTQSPPAPAPLARVGPLHDAPVARVPPGHGQREPAGTRPQPRDIGYIRRERARVLAPPV